MPPIGGWSLPIRIKGRTRYFSGTPDYIVRKIVEAHKRNGIEMTAQKVWDVANAAWIERDPKRAIVRKVFKKGPIPQPVAADAHVFTTPKDYGARLWGALSLFGIKGGFNKDHWNSQIEYITQILSPQESWASGCDECYEEWSKIRMANNPDLVSNEHDAAQWVFAAHNKINSHTGKPQIKFADAVRKNNWAFRIEGGQTIPE